MNQQQKNVVSVAQLLQIKTNFLNRNKNLMMGVLRFFVGPLLALIVMHDSVRRLFQYESIYSCLYVIVMLLFAYLACSLMFDVIAYLTPLPKVTLSTNQRKLLAWPTNYPAELIETPTTTVAEEQLQQRKDQSTLISQSTPTHQEPTQTSQQQQQPAVTSTPIVSSQATTTPAYNYSQTPQGVSNSTPYSTPYKPVSAFPTPQPQTPAPAPSPFTLSPLMGTPAQPSQYAQGSAYNFVSPQQNFTSQQSQQQTFASPQQSFSASPYPATPAPYNTTPYPNSTPQNMSTYSPYTPMLVSPLQTQAQSPLSTSQVVSPSNGSMGNTGGVLRRSRFGFANQEIDSEGALRRYMESVKAAATAEKKPPANVPIAQRSSFGPTSPAPPLPKYRNSYNDTRGSTTTTTQRVTLSPPAEPAIEEDVYSYQIGAIQTLQENGIVTKIESCTERMQEWLGSRLIPYVVKFVDLYFARSEPRNAQQWNIFHAHIQAYLDMSVYGFTQPNSADYIANRVKELNHGDVLSKFNWNRGSEGDSNNPVWDTRYPCDAQIIIHLFCTFLDLHLLADPTRTSGKPFTSKYFARTPAYPSNNSHPVIFQKALYPPHFELVLPAGKLWPVQLGYNNLYISLVCFLYQVTKNYSGYLGPISLADPEISLAWVVEEL